MTAASHGTVGASGVRDGAWPSHPAGWAWTALALAAFVPAAPFLPIAPATIEAQAAGVLLAIAAGLAAPGRRARSGACLFAALTGPAFLAATAELALAGGLAVAGLARLLPVRAAPAAPMALTGLAFLEPGLALLLAAQAGWVWAFAALLPVLAAGLVHGWWVAGCVAAGVATVAFAQHFLQRSRATRRGLDAGLALALTGTGVALAAALPLLPANSLPLAGLSAGLLLGGVAGVVVAQVCLALAARRVGERADAAPAVASLVALTLCPVLWLSEPLRPWLGVALALGAPGVGVLVALATRKTGDLLGVGGQTRGGLVAGGLAALAGAAALALSLRAFGS